MHHHRFRGFGAPRQGLSATHDRVSPHIALHFAWEWLTPVDCHTLLSAFPVMEPYARLRRAVFRHRHDIWALQQPRPPPNEVVMLCHSRTWLMGCALLLFNFVYGDFI